MQYFNLGTRIALRATFRARPVAPATEGALTTPTNVTFRVAPAGVTPTTYVKGASSAVVVASTGIVDLELTLSEYGGRAWSWDVKSTGSVEAAGQGTFYVNSEPFA